MTRGCALLLAAFACVARLRCAAADGDAAQANVSLGDAAQANVFLGDAAQASASSGVAGSFPADVKRIFIIRHAERHDGLSCLNECGWDRAQWYATWFEERDDHHPSKIYAFDYRASEWKTSCQRCAQTASWVAKEFGHSIHYVTCQDQSDKSELDQDRKMAQHLRHRIQDSDMSTILVFWEHENIPKLLRALSDEKLGFDWEDADYDSYLELHYSKECGAEHDGKFHHCGSPWHKQFHYPALHYHGASSARTCSKCQGSSSSRRRVGCPSLLSAQLAGDIGTYSTFLCER